MRAQILAVAAAVAVSAASGAESDRLSQRVPRGAFAAIEVSIIVGSITVRRAPGPDITVDVVRRVPDGAAVADMPVVIAPDGDRLVIRAARGDGSKDAAWRADVTVGVPEGLQVHATAFEGRIDLSDLNAGITASLERGAISAARVAGRVRLETAIGPIRVEQARLLPDGLLRLRTFNGDVQVTLAEPPAHARVLLLSLGGTIACDLPLHRAERWGPRWGEGTIGDGRALLSVDVVSGRISVSGLVRRPAGSR